MSSSGFSSPRSDCFPAGLRVLVVDDDPTWVKILEKMLRKCNYEVTTCNLARDALNLLRERKDGFDIVISDVNMPDMDGFKLLEHVGLEMDLPVIMMSVDGETSRVMKGVQHGACDYLLKPIRMKELRNIWQHVFRKRIHEVRDIEGHESLEEIQRMRNGTEHSDESYLFGGDMLSGKKRKDADSKSDDRGETSSAKKSRVIWSVELHQKFVKAVNQIGFDKVGPKKILDLMGLPWLTRENVASHLQKYRLYLSRLEKEKEIKSASGMKHSNLSPKDHSANVCLQDSVSQNSSTLQQKIAMNDSHDAPAHKTVMHMNDLKIGKKNMKGTASYGDVIDPPRNCTSKISFGHSSGQVNSEVKYEHEMQTQYSWRAHLRPVQLNQEQKPYVQSENMLGHLQQLVDQVPVNSVQNNLTRNPRPPNREVNKPPVNNMTHYRGNNRSLGIEKVTTVESAAALFSVQPQNYLTDCYGYEQIPPSSIWSTTSQNVEQVCFDDLTSSQRNLVLGNGAALQMWGEESNSFSSQGDFPSLDANIGDFESFGCNNQDQFDDVPPHLFEELKFDNEYPSEPVEYPVIDQGLYIA